MFLKSSRNWLSYFAPQKYGQQLNHEMGTNSTVELLNSPLQVFQIQREVYFFPEDLKINEGIPRTPETSPPLSPSSGERGEIRNSAITKS
ncbi:hypothetical protein WUBG_07119 [Wuchereria bancrofti]|uniref:Uncharacterized protein n=1 Tax=Wuchereria bancrofti TaxID=6293 RepID=J9B4M1_WUCBA|nr:hypothetical protein WUBG_07119 [Wuchereria bancrofti]